MFRGLADTSTSLANMDIDIITEIMMVMVDGKPFIRSFLYMFMFVVFLVYSMTVCQDVPRYSSKIEKYPVLMILITLKQPESAAYAVRVLLQLSDRSMCFSVSSSSVIVFVLLVLASLRLYRTVRW